jgi:hypothetical protein
LRFEARTGRALLALPVFLCLLVGCGERDGVPAASLAPVAEGASASAAFLERHWARPLAPQGKAPPAFSPLEASLSPADCGTCHADQFRDWQTALHAHAMGPGLIGQLVNMGPEARDEHQDCIRCHAPLAEQADSLAIALATSAANHAPTSQPRPALHEQGVVCAACHVRTHTRYGPPRRDGSAPASTENLPHGGFVVSQAFSDARFCSACHQFQPDEFALNGKLLENTYEEWKNSPQAAAGQSCQSCHMPARRHLWRGIHDPEMVRSGVRFTPDEIELTSGTLRTGLSVRNTGTGHYFPTYVTPRVVAEIEQVDAKGHFLPKTRGDRSIQRQVPVDLSHEIADTRLPPDGELHLDYALPRDPRATAVIYRLRVEPDEFYARFYRALLADGGAGKGKKQIQDALRQAESSGFVAFEVRRQLPD